jgi:hypothetical protein
LSQSWHIRGQPAIRFSKIGVAESQGILECQYHDEGYWRRMVYFDIRCQLAQGWGTAIRPISRRRLLGSLALQAAYDLMDTSK